MIKKNNSLVLTISPSLNKFSSRKKAMVGFYYLLFFSIINSQQTRTRYSWNSRSASSILSPSQSVGKDGGSSVGNKNISFSLIDIVTNSFSLIVGQTKQLFQVLDSITNCPNFSKRYNEVLPSQLRDILLKQMSTVLITLSKPNHLPLICSFFIDDKLCFDTFPIVLSALCVESFVDLPARVLPESIQHASTILKEFAFLIEVLDKDIENFMTTLGTILACERVDLRLTRKRSDLENLLIFDQNVLNLISKGDMRLQEMRKYSKELFCVSNSLGIITSDLNGSKGIIVRHGSVLMKQFDKYNEKVMIKAVLMLYPSGLQIYIIPLHDCVIESIWISIENLMVGNITGENGDLWISGWCVLAFQDKSTNSTYYACSPDLLTTLMWHDDLRKCVKQTFSNGEVLSKSSEFSINSGLSDTNPTTIFNVIKELIFRGCSSIKNYAKLKTKGTLKKLVQNNPNIDLATVAIEEVTDFFINYFKGIKPKLLSKSDVDLFNKIDYEQTDYELTNMGEFFESKDPITRSVLLSFLFLINCFISNADECDFKEDDGMKLLQIISDTSFKKKCYDAKRMKFLFDSIGDILPLYSLKNTPMTLVKVILMKEPVRKLYITPNQKVVVLFQKGMKIKEETETETINIPFPQDYFISCCAGEYVFLLNKTNLTRIRGNEITTIELKDALSINIFEGVLLVVFRTKFEFIDVFSLKSISTVRFASVRTVKIAQTSTGFIVGVNSQYINFFDSKGVLIRSRYIEFMSKEITFIGCKDEIAMLGFNDGSISIISENDGSEIEIINAFEGAIKDIAVGNQHIFALTSNNSVLVIDKLNFQILSVFTPLSIASSLLVSENQTLFVGTTNSILQYHLNVSTSCTSVKLSPFFSDIPQCMSALNHSFVPNIAHVQSDCLICNKPLSPRDLICRCLLILQIKKNDN